MAHLKKKKKRDIFRVLDNFLELLICEYFFRRSAKKIQVLLQSDMNNRYFTLIFMYIYGNISLNYSQNEKCFRQKLYRTSKHTFYFQ